MTDDTDWANRVADWTGDIHVGDVRDRLADLPSNSVHCVMTSPPYWGLRDYGHDDQLGNEGTVEEYVDALGAVWDEIGRVLRPDGTLWLNIDDTYNDKSLQQVPAAVARDLRQRGWDLRNRCTWVKPNPMPQSVSDRLNGETEAVFLFSQSTDYVFDLDAVREPYAASMRQRAEAGYDHKHGTAADGWGEGDHEHAANHHRGGIADETGQYGDHMHPNGKNPGDVFKVTVKASRDPHTAHYPPELCETPIKAGCPPRVCPACGCPHERVVSEDRRELPDSGTFWHAPSGQRRSVEAVQRTRSRQGNHGRDDNNLSGRRQTERTLKSWRPMCDCDADGYVPGVVLDPFVGTGTTCEVAKKLGRQWVGVEIDSQTAAIARRNVGTTVQNPDRLPERQSSAGDAEETDSPTQTGLETFSSDGGESA